MLILGIETSCDETAASLIKAENGKFKILSNAVFSQVKIHQKYKGIVPEVAARAHLEKILSVISAAFGEEFRFLKSKNLNKKLKKVDLIAVTAGPGLITSLLIGVEAAKTLSYLFKKPLIPVNHLEGHLYANWLLGQQMKEEKIFPAVCLIVSGGHTELILMQNHGQYEKLGETRDDAAGECFDKVAKLLNLGYPGGPLIEKIAKTMDYRKMPSLKLPRPMIKTQDYDFSFSGLKTAVLNVLKNREFILRGTKKQISEKLKRMTQEKRSEKKKFVREIAFETQEAIVEVLATKTNRVLKEFKAKSIILAGGVAANSRLRERLKEEARKLKKLFFVPPINLCLDNAAMIAAAGYFRYQPLNKTQKNKLLFNWQKIESNPNAEITKSF